MIRRRGYLTSFLVCQLSSLRLGVIICWGQLDKSEDRKIDSRRDWTDKTDNKNNELSKKIKNRKIKKSKNVRKICAKNRQNKDKQQTKRYQNKDESRLTKQIIRSGNHHSLTDNKGIPLCALTCHRKGPLEYATSIAHCDLGTIPKSSIGSGDDDPPKRAFDELSSLSIVIAEAGCNRLLGSVRWEWGQKNWQLKGLNRLNTQQKNKLSKKSKTEK